MTTVQLMVNLMMTIKELYEDFFQRSQERQTGKTRTTAYLKFPVESEGSDLLSFLKSRVSKRTSLEIRDFLQFEGVLVVVIIT